MQRLRALASKAKRIDFDTRSPLFDRMHTISKSHLANTLGLVRTIFETEGLLTKVVVRETSMQQAVSYFIEFSGICVANPNSFCITSNVCLRHSHFVFTYNY
jgi:hypothetical protein